MTRGQGVRVLVAGGGAVGVTAALALAGAGAKVTIADPAPLADNASGVAAGMLAPAFERLLDDARASLDLLRGARDLWPALAARLGLTLERDGAMAVGTRAQLDVWASGLADLGVDAVSLTPDEARERSPWLTASHGAVWTGEDWRLEPRAALEALGAAARALGVRWRAASVRAFNAGHATFSDGGRAPCAALVVATGASASLITVAPELAVLTPVKGHILRASNLALSGPVVRLKHVYICPAEGGALVGSTMEVGRADTDIDPAVVAALRDRAAAAASIFATTPLIARAGVRAATPDGLPLVGPGASPGVWLAAGARRNGWLLAPLVAEALAQGIVEGRTPAWAAPFSPARFSPPPA